jgi:hypothetical protein
VGPYWVRDARGNGGNLRETSRMKSQVRGHACLVAAGGETAPIGLENRCRAMSTF